MRTNDDVAVLGLILGLLALALASFLFHPVHIGCPS